MIPVTAVIAVFVGAPRAGRAGAVLAASIALAFLAISLDVDLSPRLQRGNWRGVARAHRAAASTERAITTVELGAAPLEYYLPGLHNLHARHVGARAAKSTRPATRRCAPRAGQPPAPGFRLQARLDIDGLIVYRFVSPVPRLVSEATLRRHVITLAHPEVLVSGDARLPSGCCSQSAATVAEKKI